jgi:hypothetical protein
VPCQVRGETDAEERRRLCAATSRAAHDCKMQESASAAISPRLKSLKWPAGMLSDQDGRSSDRPATHDASDERGASESDVCSVPSGVLLPAPFSEDMVPRVERDAPVPNPCWLARGMAAARLAALFKFRMISVRPIQGRRGADDSLPESQCIPHNGEISSSPSQPGHCQSLFVP